MVTRANFNSIKVRLELAASRNQLIGSVFQFHKGTIRTVSNTMIGKKTEISIP